jgi:hypothetical protein
MRYNAGMATYAKGSFRRWLALWLVGWLVGQLSANG